MFLYLFYLIYKYLNLLFFLLNLNIIILHFITQKIFIYFLIIFKNHMNINLMNMINLFQLYHINLIIIYLN